MCISFFLRSISAYLCKPLCDVLTSAEYDVCRYARYGDVSPKVDVYAFGVVLYELISAKEAIVRSTESTSDSTGLVYLVNKSFPLLHRNMPVA